MTIVNQFRRSRCLDPVTMTLVPSSDAVVVGINLSVAVPFFLPPEINSRRLCVLRWPGGGAGDLII